MVITGGEILFYQSEEQEEDFITFFQTWYSKFPELGHKGYLGIWGIWTPHTDQEEEGAWVHVHTGAALNYSDWMPGQPNGVRGENCAHTNLGNPTTVELRQWWWDRACTNEVQHT